MDTSSSELDFEMVETVCQQFYIMPRQVQDAKQMFDHYISLDNSSTITPQAVTTTNESSSPHLPSLAKPRMSVKALEMVFKDLGVMKSTIEVRDMIDELTGRIALLDKPRMVQSEEEQKPAASSVDDLKKKTKSLRPSSANTSPKRKRLGAAEGEEKEVHTEETETTRLEEDANDSTAQSNMRSFSPPIDGISFEQFVYLLLGSFEEEEEMSVRKEIETSFKKLDVDGNGELSEQDIRQAIDQYQKTANGARPQVYNVDRTDVLQLVANMHGAELELALSECDLNGDGVVTLSDFALCLLRS